MGWQAKTFRRPLFIPGNVGITALRPAGRQLRWNEIFGAQRIWQINIHFRKCPDPIARYQLRTGRTCIGSAEIGDGCDGLTHRRRNYSGSSRNSASARWGGGWHRRRLARQRLAWRRVARWRLGLERCAGLGINCILCRCYSQRSLLWRLRLLLRPILLWLRAGLRLWPLWLWVPSRLLWLWRLLIIAERPQ